FVVNSRTKSFRVGNWIRLYFDDAIKVDSRVTIGGVLRDLHESRRCDRVLIRTNSIKVLRAIQESFSMTYCSAFIR
ncbi:hypothetical protein Golax_013266, partial [Gossypium laxum]|nr:hypothetical protein [Gossypium laxum]